ncbi:MAG: hypothetical protein HY746_00925 [Elusimicrobia bacterium]|nr:hypothetical protein [Elusimicrobiota bacterium]
MIKEKAIRKIVKKLADKYPTETGRIKTCVRQTAKLWKGRDGSPRDFENFCLDNFFTGESLEILFERFEEKIECINGHFTAMMLKLRLQMDEDTGESHPVDQMFASYAPFAHFLEDMFQTKLAFTALLNFPVKYLEECLENGVKFSRKEWAQARLAKKFMFRIPPEITRKINQAYVKAENYIADYNIYLDKILDCNKSPMFKAGGKLISHWGLRDRIKSLYSNPRENLKKQQIIFKIMERITAQEIPAKFINSVQHSYEPFSNTLDGKRGKPDRARYRHLLDVFRAHRLEDKYCPLIPNYMDRKFKIQREMPEREVENMLEELLDAETGKETAELIRRRLDRNLEPFDIWYDGFKIRSKISSEELDKITARKYPDTAVFEKDIPRILEKLGFSKGLAKFIGSKIETDLARGSGHAWGPGMREEKAHLRTRVTRNGMNYQGLNIAMHELGHCVEQVISMCKIDHTLLEGVPNTAFTESFAFIFQARDMEILGITEQGGIDRNRCRERCERPATENEETAAMKTLDAFWCAREIAGVSLVDMKVWRWMYKRPDANAETLKKAVLAIAKQIWNRHYAPLIGVKDTPILAVYSHMIEHGLYLPDYPLGHIIAFQIEEYFKTRNLGAEMPRMCMLGSITPDEWMRQAINRNISPEALINAAKKALNSVTELQPDHADAFSP